MSYRYITFEAGLDGIATITVSRPEKLNALNRATVEELEDAFASAARDAAVRGLIVTGAGEKAFVAGADINELAVLSPVEAEAYARRGQRALRLLETHAQAVGGGGQRLCAWAAGWNWRWRARCGSPRRTRSWDSRK